MIQKLKSLYSRCSWLRAVLSFRSSNEQKELKMLEISLKKISKNILTFNWTLLYKQLLVGLITALCSNPHLPLFSGCGHSDYVGVYVMSQCAIQSCARTRLFKVDHIISSDG